MVPGRQTEDDMREYPDTIPEAYRADPDLADAYKDGWLVAARLENRAIERLGWTAWAAGMAADRDWHFGIWWGVVCEHQKRHWRFDDREVEEAFDAGALAAIKVGVSVYKDEHYAQYGAGANADDQPHAG
jgi:hypothetical protein